MNPSKLFLTGISFVVMFAFGFINGITYADKSPGGQKHNVLLSKYQKCSEDVTTAEIEIRRLKYLLEKAGIQ